MKSKKDVDSFPWKELTPQPVIGVDEVGRGCLAGPVYAAAVILPEPLNILGLTDSKKLSGKRRSELALLIHEHCQVSLGFATVAEIDNLNILQASLLAMKRAIEGLKINTAHVIVDGNQKVPGLSMLQTTVIKGDLRAEPIAAASIVAKVFRDELMQSLSVKYPEYGLGEHKGYGTLSHKQAIAKWGPQEFHRKSFAGVREHLGTATRAEI